MLSELSTRRRLVLHVERQHRAKAVSLKRKEDESSET